MALTGNHLFADNYTYVGDLSVIAVCLVMAALIAFSYIRKTASFRIFLGIVACLVLAAGLDVLYYFLAVRNGFGTGVILLRCLFHATLFTVFVLFTLYIAEVTRIDRAPRRRIMAFALLLLAALMLVDVAVSLNAPAEEEAPAVLFRRSQIVFIAGYLLFAGTDLVMMTVVRKRLYKRVMGAFYSSVFLAFLILLLQRILGRTSSFTVLTFLFPVISMFYIMHSNPYNPELGTISGDALPDIVRYSYERKKEFVFISLFLPAFAAEGRDLPDALSAAVRQSVTAFFRNALLFEVDNGHLLLFFRKKGNPDYEERIRNSLRKFHDYYRIYQHDYKIVVGESIDEISRKNEYVSLIRSVHRRMKLNTVHRIVPDDIRSFNRSEYILRELEDIHQKQDINDRRVLVYCQPVCNLDTGKYDTAEALMRLRLQELGMVGPDEFISLAEEHGFIHSLTRVILHKTCLEIHKLMNAGYDITRISVNVSTTELRNEHFCEDIGAVISESGVPGDKIAIELTESGSESDFELMKDKIAELQGHGIKFYLDDFGTGYSNLERIIKLPFDIIKFDRSLVLASGRNERSEKIVSNMATLFSDLDYSVLYEGVETDSDEELCRNMSASYLQGFKYSRPIPIEELRKFVPRKKNRAG